MQSVMDCKVTVTVGGHTQLDGAVLAAVDAGGADTGALTLETGTLSVTDIHDRATSHQTEVGVGVSVNQSPAGQGQQPAAGPGGTDGGEDGPDRSFSLDASHASSSFAQTNAGTIGQGSVTVREGDGTELSGVNRDVSLAQVVTEDETSFVGVYADTAVIADLGALVDGNEKTTNSVVGAVGAVRTQGGVDGALSQGLYLAGEQAGDLSDDVGGLAGGALSLLDGAADAAREAVNDVGRTVRDLVPDEPYDIDEEVARFTEGSRLELELTTETTVTVTPGEIDDTAERQRLADLAAAGVNGTQDAVVAELALLGTDPALAEAALEIAGSASDTPMVLDLGSAGGCCLDLSEADRTTALLGDVGSLSSSTELVGGLYAYAGTQFGSAAYNEVIATGEFGVEAGIIAVVPGGSLFTRPITDTVDFSSVQIEGVDPAIAGMVMVGGVFLPGPGSGEARLADGAADLVGDVVTSPGAQDLLTRISRGIDINVPVINVSIPSGRYPDAARHIQDAQAAGHPSVLTIERTGASGRRRAAQADADRVPGLQLDEYPPAFTAEGGTGASVRNISPSDNMGAGACIGNQCRSLPNGTKIKINVEE